MVGAAPIAGLPAPHPARDGLIREVHARPSPTVSAPLTVSHVAMATGEAVAYVDRAYVTELADRLGVPPPGPQSRHALMDLGTCRLRWERHTEFSTYTVLRPAPADRVFGESALAELPPDWLQSLPGQTLVTAHMEIRRESMDQPWGIEDLAAVFGTDRVFGSTVSGGKARVWSDFQPHADGFHRLLATLSPDMSPTHAGRLLQRLLEVETYRMMALLGLTEARAVSPKLTSIETDLAELAAKLPGLEGLDDERAALSDLTRLAAGVEAVSAETRYRLSATRAYADLVRARMEDLREERIEGLQRLGSFIETRLAPAASTCAATARRQDDLAERVERAGTLLRTRVDVAVEGQNQELLATMNRRAEAQLRLQETVEGLSVVAISYYLLGLVGYLFKGLDKMWSWFDATKATALALPIVVALVFFGTLQVKKIAHKSPKPDTDE